MNTEKINRILNRVMSDMPGPHLHKTGREKTDENSGAAGALNNEPISPGADNLRALDIESAWMKIIDDRFKAHSYVETIHNGRLLIKIDSSCYLSAFNIKKQELLKKIQKAGFAGIKQIDFRI